MTCERTFLSYFVLQLKYVVVHILQLLNVINNLVDNVATFKAYEPLDAFKLALNAMTLKADKYWVEFPTDFCLAFVMNFQPPCLAFVMDPRFELP